MIWPLWMFIGLGWLIVWILIAARYTAAKDGAAAVTIVGSLLPAFCAASLLVAFLAMRARSLVFHEITLWVHHTSIFLLFLFLTAGEYFQAEAWWLIRRGSSAQSVAATFRRLWVLTETMPAAIAVTIFLTGLRLIWDLPQANSPSSLWLLGLIVGFSLFFWDGILGYQPIVRHMWRNWQRVAEGRIPMTAAVPHYVADSVQLFVHFLSWPFVFLFGLFRWHPATPFTHAISQVTDHLRILPPGWPEVTIATLLWLITGVVVFLCRAAFRSPRIFYRFLESGLTLYSNAKIKGG